MASQACREGSRRCTTKWCLGSRSVRVVRGVGAKVGGAAIQTAASAQPPVRPKGHTRAVHGPFRPWGGTDRCAGSLGPLSPARQVRLGCASARPRPIRRSREEALQDDLDRVGL